MTTQPSDSTDYNIPLLLQFLELECNLGPLRDFLKYHKAEKALEFSTAGKKHDVIQGPLQDAISAGTIPIQDVLTLLAESEENGDQHILLYNPKPELLDKVSSFNYVAETLLGSDWESKIQGFPKIVEISPTVEVVDIRQNPLESDAVGWTIKLATSGIKRVKVSREMDGETLYYYKEVPHRSIILLRWNSLGFLELRIPRWESYQEVEKFREIGLTQLSKLFPPEDFVAWRMGTLAATLTNEWLSNKEVYSCQDIRFMTCKGRGMAAISSLLEEDSIHNDPDLTQLLQYLLKNKGEAQIAIVTWSAKGSNEELSKDVRSVLARQFPNDLTLLAKLKSYEVDYILRRLLQYYGINQ